MTPVQIALTLICGKSLPPFVPTPEDIGERLKMGHAELVTITGMDFGYDLQAWHEYLKESRDGGYTYGRNIELPRMMKAAIESPEWQAAVRRLADQNSN